MSIKFYNTLTKRKEEFHPITEDEVKLYTCGPTVYDTAHIGNFRTFLFEDLLKRFLLLKGYKVIHAMNLTDVDDKTILRSNSDNISIHDLTEKYIELFFNDLQTLKIIPADHYPKATEHITEMIEMVERLIENGYAYKSNDNSVYFKIDNQEWLAGLLSFKEIRKYALYYGEATIKNDKIELLEYEFRPWDTMKKLRRRNFPDADVRMVERIEVVPILRTEKGLC